MKRSAYFAPVYMTPRPNLRWSTQASLERSNAADVDEINLLRAEDAYLVPTMGTGLAWIATALCGVLTFAACAL